MGKPIHVKKFMGGRITPEEAHAIHGIRKKCVGCGRPAIIRAKVFATLADFKARMPEAAAIVASLNPLGPFVPTVQMTYGEMVMISDVGACKMCKPQLLRTAAKHPDWTFVEFDDAERFKGKSQTQVPL
jgi:hypothetical protein